MPTPDPIDAAISAFWQEFPLITVRMRMQAAIRAYENALWQEEPINGECICQIIDGKRFFRPLPRKE
jgi:hypothetical protein